MLDIVKLKFVRKYSLAAVRATGPARGIVTPLHFLGQSFSDIDKMPLTPVCCMEFYGAIC